MADQSLLELAKMVCLAQTDADSRQRQRGCSAVEAGVAAHLPSVWNAGHVLVREGDPAGVAAAANRPPAWLYDLVTTNSALEADPAKVGDGPTAAQVQAKLIAQLDEFIAAISTLTDDRLSQPAGPDDDKTLRGLIAYGMHHEAGHQGEMYLLKKLQMKAQS